MIGRTRSGGLLSRIRSFADILTRYGAAIAGVLSFAENDTLGERRRRSGFEALYIDCRVVREGHLSDSKSTVQAGYTF